MDKLGVTQPLLIGSQSEVIPEGAPPPGTLRERVLEHIVGCGIDGATGDETERALGVVHQSISPRCGELYDGGWIQSAGTRSTMTGCNATVWTASAAAIGLYRPKVLRALATVKRLRRAGPPQTSCSCMKVRAAANE